MNERIILHSDVNNFFASVECCLRPELKNLPVAVTGNPEKRTGVILAKNEIAKSFGVKTGQTIYEAKNLCKDLICLPPHYEKYEKISKQLHEVYLKYTDLVEPLGLDECWLDVTSSSKLLKKTGEEIALEIKEYIKNNFGFTVSVGVSFSKIFAKLGSDLKKPDAITVIPKNKFKEITYHLPLNSIIGIGKRLEKKFTKINIKTIGEFCNLKPTFINSIMGKNGIKLLENLLGRENDAVKCYFLEIPPKSIGNGTTTIKDIYNRNDIEKVVTFLADKISKRLIKKSYQAKTLSVTLKTAELTKLRKSCSFPPTFASEVISERIMYIIDSFFDYKLPIRAIRIRASNLTKIDKNKQLSFFENKKENTAIGIEQITEKYGTDAIFRASENAEYINRKNHTEE